MSLLQNKSSFFGSYSIDYPPIQSRKREKQKAAENCLYGFLVWYVFLYIQLAE